MKKKYKIYTNTILKIWLFAIIAHTYMAACSVQGSVTPRILVVTGGHAYDTAAFENFFLQSHEVNADMIMQPQANQALANGKFKDYEAVVFYDMWQDISPGQKKAFLELTQNGTGLIFLHHSLVSYQKWDAFEKITGGRYLQKNYVTNPSKASGYKHGLDLEVTVVHPDHPITKNMKDFSIHDEGYSNLKILPTVKPLLKTEHPDCADTVAWANQYNNSRIVYILLGHDQHGFLDKDFKQLIFSAIRWVAGK